MLDEEKELNTQLDLNEEDHSTSPTESSQLSKFFFWLFFILEIGAFIAGAGCTIVYASFISERINVVRVFGVLVCIVALILLIWGMVRASRKYKTQSATDGSLMLIGVFLIALFIFGAGCAIGLD